MSMRRKADVDKGDRLRSNNEGTKTESDNNNVTGHGRKEKCEKLLKKFCELKRSAKKRGLSHTLICDTFRGVYCEQGTEDPIISIKTILLISVVTAVIVSALLGFLMKYFALDQEILELVSESRCVVDNGGFIIEVARPLTNCSMCKDLKQVPVERDISPEDFLEKYAYSAVPVLIKDATINWTAMSSFSFHFFKKLYTETKDALEKNEDECQFFPYKTEFHTLADVFNMSDERAGFKVGEKPWYIGWSNCHTEVAKTLRKHYQRPYFIPSDSESSALDWIFMGGPGLGAFVHLDYVQRPSWQAQIKGKKTWTLIPTPECEDVCSSMNVTVSKGDIFVIDTNEWYHATHIHPGEISITIGSEYD